MIKHILFSLIVGCFSPFVFGQTISGSFIITAQGLANKQIVVNGQIRNVGCSECGKPVTNIVIINGELVTPRCDEHPEKKS